MRNLLTWHRRDVSLDRERAGGRGQHKPRNDGGMVLEHRRDGVAWARVIKKSDLTKRTAHVSNRMFTLAITVEIDYSLCPRSLAQSHGY